MISEKAILIPMHLGTKRPMIKDWGNITCEQSKELQTTYKNCNWGLLLGHPDTNYVDVDVEIDHVNSLLSLKNTFEFGRKSRRGTGHYIYSCKDLESKNYKYFDHNKVLLFELRGQGLVTIPPSIYDEDAIIASDNKTLVSKDYSQLKKELDNFYIAYIIANLYPSVGLRQSAVMGFTGWLLKNQIPDDEVLNLWKTVYDWVHDDEASQRLTAINATIVKFKQDPDSVSGIGILKDIFTLDTITFLKSIFKSPDKLNVIEYFNELYTFINNPKGIWDISHSCYVELQALRNQYAHKKVQQIKDEKVKEIPAINFWIASEKKSIMEEIVYEPGKTFTDKINTWKGWGIEPSSSGDIGPILHLLSYLFEQTNDRGNLETNQEKLSWFLDWLAYPLQNPGEKNHTAVLLYSNHQGVGKNLIGYVMEDIYGNNFAQLGDDAFDRQFNDYLMGKQFIIGNELTGKDKWNGIEKLKMLITEPRIEINRKFQPVVNIKNCVNLMLLSNNPDPLVIRRLDRRFFVWFIQNPPLSDMFYQKIFVPWKKQGGSARFFQWLLDRDLTQYSPQAHAPTTDFKEEIQEMHQSSLELVLRQKIKEETTPEIVSVNWLYTMYFGETGLRLTPIQIGRAMFSFTLTKRRVNLGGCTQTVWAIKNINEWKTSVTGRWIKYLKRTHGDNMLEKNTI